MKCAVRSHNPALSQQRFIPRRGAIIINLGTRMRVVATAAPVGSPHTTNWERPFASSLALAQKATACTPYRHGQTTLLVHSRQHSAKGKKVQLAGGSAVIDEPMTATTAKQLWLPVKKPCDKFIKSDYRCSVYPITVIKSQSAKRLSPLRDITK